MSYIHYFLYVQEADPRRVRDTERGVGDAWEGAGCQEGCRGVLGGCRLSGGQ